MDQTIRHHFRSRDPLLFAVLEHILSWDDPLERSDYYVSLCQSIISQQLSGKAADTIIARFETLLGNNVTPDTVLQVSEEQLRAAGMSWSKVRFLRALAEAIQQGVFGEEGLEGLDGLENEEVIVRLTKVKGIGRWTAEMFLMFTLKREDVFSYGDLGLKRAIQKLYGFKKEPTPKQIAKLEKHWSPYRTWACRILWKSLELPR